MKNTIVTLSLFCLLSATVLADKMDSYQIGSHGQGNLKYPPWFKQTFFDLSDDLAEAKSGGKRGLIVYFSQKNCNHCVAFNETTLNDTTILKRLTEKYDVIALDIFSDVEIILPNGKETTIKNYAEISRARFTPTLLFYGVENKPLVKIVGFYPPEKFAKVLDYIDEEHYKNTRLSNYLRSSQQQTQSSGIIFDSELFGNYPQKIEINKNDNKSFSLVMFESPNCNSCERFHKRVLSDKTVRQLMKKYRTLHLDSSNSSVKITINDGSDTTPKKWTEKLQLNYDYSIVFFDENGNEVHRIDAETGLDRMTGSLQYVQEKAYERHQQFLQWRKENAIKKLKSNS
jgi:thioredoxin-related protein